MPITFSCESCGKALRVKEAMAGKRAKCPGCNYNIRVPVGVSPDHAKSATRTPIAPEPQDNGAEIDFVASTPASEARRTRRPASNPYSAPPSDRGPARGPVRRTRLVRVGAVSMGMATGAAAALGGLIVGLIYLVVSIIMAFVAPQAALGALGTGLAAALILPVFNGLAGFLGGLLRGAVYNFAAGFTGGVELELE